MPTIIPDASGLEPGQMRTIDVGGHALLLVNLDGALYAVDDTCTHDECSLGEGFLEEDVVECPCHGATFNVRTGEALTLPATRPLRTYPVRHTVEGAVQVDP